MYKKQNPGGWEEGGVVRNRESEKGKFVSNEILVY